MSAARHRQQGIALVTAIFVVTLAAIAAAAMAAVSNLATHRMNNLQGSEQAEWYALSIEIWVCALLQRESATLRHGYTGLGDPWARTMSGFPIDRGLASGHLEDLQGRFNINNLGALNPRPYLEQFQRLLDHIPGLNHSAAAELGPAIRDWIDVDGEPWEGVGAEDGYYLALPLPYRTSNLLMRSPSELLSVRGMTPELYAAIYPYIATLPTTSAKVNINTAPLPVLESLGSEAGGTGFSQFVAERVSKPLASVQEAVTRGVFPKDSNPGQFVDVSSGYFQLQTAVEVDGMRMQLYSTIAWPASGMPAIVSHSFGTD